MKIKLRFLCLVIFLLFPFISFAQGPILWGMTYKGGTYNAGTIFYNNTSSGEENVLHDFGDNNDGAYPQGSLIQANNGLLYGMTTGGGLYGGGTIFSYNISTGTYTILHDFGINDTDGTTPYGALFQASNGVLYGMTNYGGTVDSIYDNGEGTIFSYDISTGIYAVDHSFGSTYKDGIFPYGSLIQVNNGLLYGLTYEGGDTGVGAIFSYNINTGKDTVLYSFGKHIPGGILSYYLDGAYPYGSLMQASNGLLYGMTAGGGLLTVGTIFSYNISTGKDSLLYSFSGGCQGQFGGGTGGGDGDGAYPYGSLLQVDDSLLYGLTTEGGFYGPGCSGAENGTGAIFFYNINADTEYLPFPYGYQLFDFPEYTSLIQGSNGSLYGMTAAGGSSDSGIIFSYNNGSLNTIHNFIGNNDGAWPYASLIEVDSPVTGINRLAEINNNISLYPNPSNGNFTIKLQNIKQTTQVEIFNVLGEKIYTTNLNTTTTPINLSNQAAGIYLYRVLDGQGTQIGDGKFVIE